MKLYWRIKKNGKWTWKPAVIAHAVARACNLPNTYIVFELEEEE